MVVLGFFSEQVVEVAEEVDLLMQQELALVVAAAGVELVMKLELALEAVVDAEAEAGYSFWA